MKNLTDHLKMLATIVAGLATLAVVACGGSAKVDDAAASATSTSLSSAVASGTASSGTLICTPAQGQIDACTGKISGDACILTSTNGTATLDVAGTCRTTIDGASVACAPNPPAPPQELVAACTGLTSGAACTVTEAFGDTRSGVCMTARDSTTLVCGRVQAPPQVAIDACASLTAGATCSMGASGHQGAMNGICSLGPASTGPLACAPSHDLIPNGQAACTGIAVGAACTLGHGRSTASGTCVMPPAGTAAVCVVACADLGGGFRCGPGGPGGPMGPSGPMGPGGPPMHY